MARSRHIPSSTTGHAAGTARQLTSRPVTLSDYRTLVDSFPHVVWMTEPDGSTVYCNQHWFDLTGLTLAQTIGDGWLAVVHPEDVEQALEVWKKAVKGGVAYASETRFRRASDGQYRWHQATAFPVKDQAGAIVNWIGTAVDIHDTKITLQQLADSEYRLRSILETEPECIKVVSRECLLLEMNPAGLAMLEVDSADQVVGQSLLGLVHSEYQQAFRELTKQVFRGKDGELEFEITGLKGTHRWLHTHATPLRNKSGSIQALLAVTRDVTKQKNSENELRASEARFRALIENSSDAIALFDAQGNVTFVSPSTENMLQFKPSELLGRPLGEFVHPDDLAMVQRGFHEAVTHPGEAITLCGRIRRRDGSYRVLEGVFTSLLHDSSVRAIVNNFRDVTERVQAEEALRRSEERFAKAFRSSPLGITVSTLAEGRYLDVNEAFLQMLGYTKEEVVGKTVQELGIWEIAQDRASLLRKLQESGRVTALQTSFRAHSGEIRMTEVSAELIQLADVPCLLAITHDVTQAKRLEAQFRQSQKMEAVGQLAGGVAHDFNNLLGVIIGYSEISEALIGNNEPLSKYVEQIKKAAQRAATLTRQLLAFSRQQVLQPVVLDLNTVVHNLSKMLLRLLGEDVSLLLVPGSPLGCVKADLGQMEQVLMNLVVNSRDALPKGGKIRIETQNVDMDESNARQYSPMRPGAYVLLSVSDNGCGMDASTKARIFEPFFTTKGSTSGTGLGLSTVYGIVKQSGGYVWVDSELGKGATFKIYFPRNHDVPVSLIQPKTNPSHIRGFETILLVEDDEPLRKLTRSLLEANGYKVLEADSAPTAIRLAQAYEAKIDLLLTDVIMPSMGGSELAAVLQSARLDVKVLYVSGYTGSQIARHGVLEADTALLYKPFTKESLLDKVRSVLTA